MSESPYSTDYIEGLVSRDEASLVWPVHENPFDAFKPYDTCNDWIYAALLELDLTEQELAFVDAIGAGHRISGAARLVGKPEHWGYNFMKRLRRDLANRKPNTL